MKHVVNPDIESEKVHRVLFILKEFLMGKSYSSDELRQVLAKRFGEVSLRTVQRDLKVLQECIPSVERVKVFREVVWKIPHQFRSAENVVHITTNELLSFHILKAHLSAFKGTSIAEDIEHLYQKLEEVAPGNAFSEESIYWDQNVGQYDYTDYDPIFKQIIHYITKNIWVNTKYKSEYKETIKQYDLLFRKMFHYFGSIYIAAYIPKYDEHISLKVQNILEMQESKRQTLKAPDFDFYDFTKRRFGVFSDRIKKVVLKIKKENAHLFDKRRWHPTQKNYYDDEENLYIQLFVPIVPDFVGWLMSWGNIIQVEKPDELIQRLKSEYTSALSLYEDVELTEK